VKVEVTPLAPTVTTADATWFEEEETLFFFYDVHAEQGLEPESRVEVSWRTDSAEQPWTPVSELAPVHTHVPVDCGPKARCGSTSVRVAERPRDVRLRLRYHPDGELAFEPRTAFNAIARGPAHTHRSLLVYGVFDASNRLVQWRARHQFPTLRNVRPQELGLRRHFAVQDAAHGEVGPLPAGNPYGYGLQPACPSRMEALGWGAVETEERAVFTREGLPLSASASPAVCARATVRDARGTFTAVALARRNPEVAPAFPLLRSPVRPSTRVGVVLRACGSTASEAHLRLQRQRLLLEGAPEVCVDGWREPSFPAQLAAALRARVDAARSAGQDMVLTLVLHHAEQGAGLRSVVEAALGDVLLPERSRVSPRVNGAFVFDSAAHLVQQPELRRLVLWCPGPREPTGQGGPPPEVPDIGQTPPDYSGFCNLQADQTDLQLGPFRLGAPLVFPSRSQYLTFLERYGEAQAGRTRTLDFRAPVRTPLSEDVPLGDLAVATFFNNEVLTASPTDAFSFCSPGQEDPLGARLGASAAVFRSPLTPEGVLPLTLLPLAHDSAPQASYPLGLAWGAPFRLDMVYEGGLAGSVSAFSFTVPFGISSSEPRAAGSELWTESEFDLSKVLVRCSRFCEHPTFDEDGTGASEDVYNLRRPFRGGYHSDCYDPDPPQPGGGGFPYDP
jgi:hypothetical protein